MPRSRLALVLSLAAAALGFGGAAQALAADVPSARTLYESGPSGRYLIDGDWQFRRGTTGTWKRVEVPYSWNVTDPSAKSFIGGVAEYRKDFELPSAQAAYKWIVRFESVNYRAKVYLNGTLIGENAGAYLPFEILLPAKQLKRSGSNRLLVRVDNRRTEDDLPPMGLSLSTGQPTGGWWNYGGILREVYLRRVQHTDFSTVQVLPDLPCATCPATIKVRATVHNYDALARPVHVTGTFGALAFDAGTFTLGPGDDRVFTENVPVAKPELWSPKDPNLYPVTLTARVGTQVAQTWKTESGIRSVKVVGGRLYLNGSPLNWRGFGLHEDSLDKGFALDNADREQIVADVKDLGATLIRSHYPLHPQLMELADREGLMVWSEIPMYQLRTNALKHASVRNFGVRMLEKNVLTNGNHPSVVIWSIANELNSNVNADQGAYIKKAAAAAHRLDFSRPVGQAVASNPTGSCQKRFAPLDIIGFNEYFNWYPGPDGSMADRDNLGLFLEKIRRCYPTKALAITEFGAEANRSGPVEERGTYEFQQAFVNFHLDEFERHPWLSGATYWALQEFRVRPNWDGGNPRPEPPFHQKGLITLSGERKPAYFDVQRRFRETEQFPAR
ncbi:MAG: glycoside hydrolase family 2 protein [Solirubrobacteraceae bacterium]